MNHTPGPWVAPAEQVNFITTKRAYESQQIGELKHSFQATVTGCSEDEMRANASLIAAAPEMQKQLRTSGLVVEAFIKYLKTGILDGSTYSLSNLEGLSNDIQDALLKARGGEK